MLVVSEPEVCATLHDWLVDLGFDVVVAENGDDAVTRFTREFYKLVIFWFDNDRPDMLRTLGRMRLQTGGRPTTAMAVTGAQGSALGRLRSFSAHLGVTSFLHLPLERSCLIARLAESIGMPGDEGLQQKALDLAESLESEQDRLLRLQFELYELSRQPATARLGLESDAGTDEIRQAYFELVTAYHAEGARARTEQARRAVDRIQGVLSESYLALRRRRREAPEQDDSQAATSSTIARDLLARDSSIQAVRRREVLTEEDTAQTLLESARLALVISDYARASRLLRRVLVMQPSSREARYYLMLALERARDRSANDVPAAAAVTGT